MSTGPTEERGLPVSFLPSTARPEPRTKRLPQLALAAMESFSCLAERCEDTCCRDWAVPVDRESFDRMRDAMVVTPKGRERLVRLVVIGRPTRDADSLASLQLDARGACPMLEMDNRCGVHADFGEEALATACAVFPRTALAVAGHLEIGGSLGCPEVSRLVLLAEDGPVLRPSQSALLSRDYVGKVVNDDESDAYAHRLPAVRELLLRLFTVGEHALGARLVFAADFAQTVGAFFFAGAPEFLGARRAFAERRLRKELHAAAEPASLSALEADLAGLDAPGEGTVALIVTWLLDRKRLPHSARYADLLRDVMTSAQEEALGRPASPDDTVTPTQLWQVYVRRRAALDARARRRCALIFGNFCRHFLLRHPYTDSASLLEHLYKLALQLAAVRFLTIMHPDLAARLASAPDAAADEETLDRVAVHAIQTFSKAIGHHPEYLDTMTRSAKATGGFTFGRLVMFAKFV